MDKVCLLIVMVLSCLVKVNAQDKYTILEDDHFMFSVLTPSEMELNYDTLNIGGGLLYYVYSGNVVNNFDTFYYRIDLWEQELIKAENGSVYDQETYDLALDSTLQYVVKRLGGKRIYSEQTSRNSWPARIARIHLPTINKYARVLLVRRHKKFYLLTAISSSTGIKSEAIDQFIHTLKIL